MNDAQILNWIIQGGSFGLIVAVMVYMGWVLIPQTIAAFSRQAEKFDAALERQESRSQEEHERRDDAIKDVAGAVRELTGTVRQLAEQIERQGERIERLEAGSREHHALHQPGKQR